MDRRIDRLADVGRQAERQRVLSVLQHTCGRRDRWVGGWMGGWIDRHIDRYIDI